MPTVTDLQMESALSQASAWQVKLAEQGQESSVELEAWLAAAPEHLQAWNRVNSAWTMMGELGGDPAMLQLRRDALDRAMRAERERSRWQGSSRSSRSSRAAIRLVASLFLLLSGVGLWWSSEQPDRHTTAIGQRQSVALADGSHVVLDAASSVSVRYTDDARVLELERGQARFDVAPDPLRPFKVRAGAKVIVALGTSFNVELIGRDVVVTLIEGRVNVIDAEPDRSAGVRPPTPVVVPRPPRPEPDVGATAVLEAGMQLRLPEQSLPQLRQVDVMRQTAWERGLLDIEDERLADVVARLNRYHARTIRIPDDRVANMRVSGIVRTADPLAFAELVVATLPVRAETRDGEMVLVPR